jgi:hypothetical protein
LQKYGAIGTDIQDTHQEMVAADVSERTFAKGKP